MVREARVTMSRTESQLTNAIDQALDKPATQQKAMGLFGPSRWQQRYFVGRHQ
jgi:hypothetical protein